MPDLGKLASLSQRMKQTKITVAPGGGQEGSDENQASQANPGATPVPNPAPPVQASSQSPQVGVASGSASQAVSFDLSPLHQVLGEIRDGILGLSQEVRKIREGGMPMAFGEESSELAYTITRQMTTQSKAVRELTDKLLVSLPESRWFEEVRQFLQAKPQVGIPPGMQKTFAQIVEQLNLQRAQLAAILSKVEPGSSSAQQSGRLAQQPPRPPAAS